MATKDFKRKLTAILSADVKGYSRLMGEDEAQTVKTITAYREVMAALIKQHRGRVIDSPGDNLLAEFASVVDAVQCAVAVQKEFHARNAELPENRRMVFRIGINLGDVIQEGERIYGDGVNIAARLESLADPGGICVSKTAFDHIETKLPLGYEYLGEQTVKNIAKPVGAYRVLMEPRVTVAGERKEAKAVPLWRRKAILAGGVAFVVVVIAALIWNFYFRPPPMEVASVEKMAFPLPDKPSIAVLPFNNLSGDPEQEYFSDGLTEEIITALSKVPKLFVIARNSTFTYKGKPVKVQQVSEQLGVRYVLEGSVRKAEDRVRITAQLIDATTGRHLWSERYDRDLKDIFALQDEITKKIITALQVKLTEGEQARLYAKGTDDLVAYLKALEGWWYCQQTTKDGNRLARKLAEEAIALDPKYAFAYNVLGITHTNDLWLGLSKSPRNSLMQAIKMAKKAIALDDSHAGTHALLGYCLTMARRHDEGIAEGEKAVLLWPSSAGVLQVYATILTYAGRREEAIPLFREALRLNPMPPNVYYRHFGMALRDSGRYEEAIALQKKAIEQDPNDFFAYVVLTSSYSLAGRDTEARAAAEEVIRINPRVSVARIQKVSPHKDRAVAKRYCDALRKAGLPDKPPLPLPDKPSIAVLPFVNMSGDPEQEYFSDGMTEEIITALSKTPKLFVIARHSTFTYKGKSVKIQQVGRDLGVRYVLEGSVRKAGDKVRITAQLIDATTEKHLWAERYDRDLKDVFAIQDEITLAIIKAMQVEFTKGEMADVTGRGTKNLDAYLKALQAQAQWWRMDKEGTLKASQLAMEAIAIDRQYGYPYAIVSWSHMMDVWLQSTESPKESMRLAVEAIQKALALDESDHRIHIVLSNLYIMQGKNNEAIDSAERAVGLCPGGALAHSALGTALRYACRFSEAVQFREQAIKLDPFPTAADFRNLAVAYLKVGQYEDAIVEYKKALHINPSDWAIYFGLVEAYAKLGRKEEARVAAAELLRVRPKFSLDWLAKTIVRMYAAECRSKINDDIEFVRKADVGLK